MINKRQATNLNQHTLLVQPHSTNLHQQIPQLLMPMQACSSNTKSLTMTMKSLQHFFTQHNQL